MSDQSSTKQNDQEMEILQPLFKNFINQLSVGFFLFNVNGEMVASNKLGQRLLSEKQIKEKELNNQVKITLQTQKELMLDWTGKDRVFRCRTEHLSLDKNQVFCSATIRDITEEWRLRRQRIVLEYTAHSLSQNISTTKWLTSILKQIRLIMKIRNCTIYLFDKENQRFFKKAQAIKNEQDKKIDFAKGPVAQAVKNKSYILTGDLVQNKQTNFPTLYLPMLIDDQVVGILEIENHSQDFFRYTDVTFYTTLANRMAIALEHKNLVEEIKETHGKLKTVLDNTEHGMVLLDKDCNILLTNTGFSNLINQDVKELIGQSLGDILPELLKPLEKQQYQNQELELKSLPEKPFVRINLVPIKESEGNETVLSIQNISKEKILEQMKNDFVSTATHELRTPLTAILGYLSIIAKQNENLNEKQKIYLNRINTASENLAILIEELLSVLRLEQDRSDLELKLHNLKDLTKEVVDGLEIKMQKKNMSIKLEDENYQILTDDHAFKRVFSNLVDNAIKYSHPDTQIKVEFSPLKQDQGHFLRIDVIDKGVGIPENKQDQLFEKFNRIPNKFSIEAGGTGLGLYISKMLVDKWGGKIYLAKSSPSGSTFSFTVPMKS